MPNLHLTKVAVRCASVEALENRLVRRARQGEVRVPTRMRPRRADELIGGNLYWIVKQRLVGFNVILRIADRSDGRIDFVCSAELVRIAPVARRGHQGWRYLSEADSPSLNDDDGSGLSALPSRLHGRLAALALV